MNLLSQFVPGTAASRLALSVAVQVTGVVGVAAVVSVLLRRRAAARHGLWLGALLWVLMTPAVAVVADRAGLAFWAVDLPVIHVASTRPSPASSGMENVAMPREATTLEGQGETVSPTAPPEVVAAVPARSVAHVPPVKRDWPVFWIGLTAVWAAGVFIGLLRMLAGRWRVGVMTRAARPLDPLRYGEALAQARDALGVAELPPVVVSPGAAGPVAAGLFRPRVVLPEGLADSLTAGALRDVLVHECAHVVRRDTWVGLLQRLSAALFWPHPLIHYLNAQLARAREEVCDNFVFRSRLVSPGHSLPLCRARNSRPGLAEEGDQVPPPSDRTAGRVQPS